MANNDMRNALYLRAVLDSVQKEAIAFYNGAATPEERLARVIEIRDALKAINVTGFTIAAPNPEDIEGEYGCPPGTSCKGGVCVDKDAPIEWPPDADPEA